MTPQTFLKNHKYVARIEFDANLKRCYFYRSDSKDEESTSNDFRGGVYTDAKSVDAWAVINCKEDTEWTR